IRLLYVEFSLTIMKLIFSVLDLVSFLKVVCSEIYLGGWIGVFSSSSKLFGYVLSSFFCKPSLSKADLNSIFAEFF
ncbi:hypothetical protein DF186_21665, partial [Enterococcus hirae]